MNQTEAEALSDGRRPAELRPLAPLDVGVATQVLRFVQLLCEGHYSPMQNYLRTQEGNRTNINLLHELVNSSNPNPNPNPNHSPSPTPKPSPDPNPSLEP